MTLTLSQATEIVTRYMKSAHQQEITSEAGNIFFSFTRETDAEKFSAALAAIEVLKGNGKPKEVMQDNKTNEWGFVLTPANFTKIDKRTSRAAQKAIKVSTPFWKRLIPKTWLNSPAGGNSGSGGGGASANSASKAADAITTQSKEISREEQIKFLRNFMQNATKQDAGDCTLYSLPEKTQVKEASRLLSTLLNVNGRSGKPKYVKYDKKTKEWVVFLTSSDISNIISQLNTMQSKVTAGS